MSCHVMATIIIIIMAVLIRIIIGMTDSKVAMHVTESLLSTCHHYYMM